MNALRLKSRLCAAPFFAAAALVVVGFAADTATTLAGGEEFRARDLNPLVRDLSENGYVAWSGARLAAALGILALAWPQRPLRAGPLRESRWFALVWPFARRPFLRCAACVAVTALGPLKLVAAVSNLALIARDAELLSPAAVFAVGIPAGIVVGNALLAWQAKSNCP